MYMIIESYLDGKFALVGNGQRFEFPAKDGHLIADIIDAQWPACEGCEDRETCEDCGKCINCDCECEDDGEEDEEPDLAMSEHGRCDTCGAACNGEGCSANPAHAASLE